MTLSQSFKISEKLFADDQTRIKASEPLSRNKARGSLCQIFQKQIF